MTRNVILPPQGGLRADGSMPAGWWHQSETEQQRVICDVCPRRCSLAAGQRGFCFVRENRDGQIVSTTYGRSTGFCIDPIEKKPLAHFYPGTPVLSFGTAGCNLGCKFCQNWTMSRSRDVHAGCDVADPQTIAAAASQLGCRSVAFTYNDPIIWVEYAIDTARACRRLGVKTVAVTSGYINPACRETFYQDIDAANIDLKGFSEEFYREYCAGRLEPVLDTLRWLVQETDVWVEITNLVIPQANDSRDELEQMCRWIVEELGPDVPLHFSAFHPDFKVTDRGPTPLQTLVAAHDIARTAGVNFVYTGNVSDRDHQCTYCPRCERVLIERDGYVLGEFHIDDGRCEYCGAQIAGRWDRKPGNWGSRRTPVRIDDYRESDRLAPAATPGDRKSARLAPAATPADIAKEKSNVKRSKANPSGPPAGSTEKPELGEQQQALIFAAASRRVAAAVTCQSPEVMRKTLADVADTPLYGAFVSLKRGGQLRSCCGYLGQSIPLAEAVDRASVRAAQDDPRFPPISPSELEHLDMEVWLLWGLEPVAARGEDRIGAVVIGRHGLQIARGMARGLLLPGVAVEHNLDAKGFLEQVCLKAGLPIDAWRSDDTTLMTFEGYAIRGRLQAAEAQAKTSPDAPTQGEVAALADFCRSNLLALLQGATPSYYLPGGFDGGVNGLALDFGEPGRQGVQCSQLSLRPEIPLQSTLFALVQSAARALAAERVDPAVVRETPVELSVLLDPAVHGSAADAQLEGFDPERRAVVLLDRSRWAWVYDPQKTAEELLQAALQAGEFPEAAATRLFSAAVVSTRASVTVAQVPRAQAGPQVRRPAVAGTFYPATSEEIDRQLDEIVPEAPQPEPWPAVMVPHAGWTYSGRLAAEVFSRVEIPPRVLIFAPQHRGGGAEWAVAPHETWSLPGRQVPSDPELARLLAQRVTGLKLDAAAHRQEHSIEVQLPILARLAPHAKVVGVAIGGGELAGLLEFGRQLAEVLGDMPERPLLVISSDMNHFADDQQTRRLDRIALDAMETLDPSNLYEAVRENRISMCGFMPAVIVMEALRQLDQLHRCELVGYATSADVTGDSGRVVGYAGMLLGYPLPLAGEGGGAAAG